jgi:hypothetical protein
VVL